jgi:hypothetical protein
MHNVWLKTDTLTSVTPILDREKQALHSAIDIGQLRSSPLCSHGTLLCSRVSICARGKHYSLDRLTALDTVVRRETTVSTLTVRREHPRTELAECIEIENPLLSNLRALGGSGLVIPQSTHSVTGRKSHNSDYYHLYNHQK